MDTRPKNQTETVLAESELTSGLPAVVQKDASSYRKPEKVLVTIACRWLFVSICIHHCSIRAMAHSHLRRADCGGRRSSILMFHFPYLSFDVSFKDACIQPAKIVGTSTAYTERTPGVFLPWKDPSPCRILFCSLVRIFALSPFGFHTRTLLSFVLFGLELDGGRFTVRPAGHSGWSR